MPAEGLDCRTESVERESGVMRIEDASIVKEYALKVPRKSAIEGLEFMDTSDTDNPILLMSTGNYGGSLNVLEMNENGEEWNLKSTIKVDPQYFGMGLTTVNSDTYVLTWRAQKVLKYSSTDLMSDNASESKVDLKELPYPMK